MSPVHHPHSPSTTLTPIHMVHPYPIQWNVEFDHCTTLRRLVAHHPELLMAEAPDFRFVAFAAKVDW